MTGSASSADRKLLSIKNYYLGDDFEDEGGVSRPTTSFSPFATSAACLFESGLELFLKNKYVDM